MRSLHCVVFGTVTDGFFPSWVHDQEVQLGLAGWVRRLAEDKVEVLAQGAEDKARELALRLRQGTAVTRVDEVRTDWIEYEKAYQAFEIRA